MKILVVGATGFIGSAVTARLASGGHEIAAVARRPNEAGWPPTKWVRLDIAQATDPAAWTNLLTGVDAVVNCAGTLQGALGESTLGRHQRASRPSTSER